MRVLALIIILGSTCPASAGYNEAIKAVVNLGGPWVNQLDAYLTQPGAALANNPAVTGLLSDNEQALELFRQAAAETNEGYLFAPKPEKPNSATPPPVFKDHMKLLRLLMLSARVNAAQERPGAAEKDLLAAAGFMSQLSAQKSGVLASTMLHQLCLQKVFPAFAESMRGGVAAPAYLGELAARLGASAAQQDFMQAAMREEGGTFKVRMREAITLDEAARERAKRPFLQRLAMKRLQDEEFISIVHAKFDALTDARVRAFAEAFRRNDRTIADEFIKQEQRQAEARRDAYSKRGIMTVLKDTLNAGTEAKEGLAVVMADNLAAAAVPDYGRIIPLYHAAYNQLNVLRAALAVKRLQRATRRLPATLDQLVPAYLDAVPQDTFNGSAPLRYVRKGKRFSVYSFGPDLRDDGGAIAINLDAYRDNPAAGYGDIVFYGY